MKTLNYDNYSPEGEKVMTVPQLVPVLLFYKDGDSDLLGYVLRGTDPKDVYISPDFARNSNRKIDKIIVCGSLADILTLWG